MRYNPFVYSSVVCVSFFSPFQWSTHHVGRANDSGTWQTSGNKTKNRRTFHAVSLRIRRVFSGIRLRKRWYVEWNEDKIRDFFGVCYPINFNRWRHDFSHESHRGKIDLWYLRLKVKFFFSPFHVFLFNVFFSQRSPYFFRNVFIMLAEHSSWGPVRSRLQSTDRYERQDGKKIEAPILSRALSNVTFVSWNMSLTRGS